MKQSIMIGRPNHIEHGNLGQDAVIGQWSSDSNTCAGYCRAGLNGYLGGPGKSSML